MAEQPATTAVVALCVAIWLHTKSKSYGELKAMSSYKEAFDAKHGSWKIRAFQVVHLDFVHLMFNMLSCWALGFIEKEHGTWYYITMSAVMLEVVALVKLAGRYVLVHVRKEEHRVPQYCIDKSMLWAILVCCSGGRLPVQ